MEDPLPIRRPPEVENVFADDYSKALSISRDHLGTPITEVAAAAIEFLGGLPAKKQDGYIRSRLGSKSGQARKSIKLSEADRARADQIRGELLHVTRVVIIGAALDAFSRATFDRRRELFRERYARRNEPVSA